MLSKNAIGGSVEQLAQVYSHFTCDPQSTGSHSYAVGFTGRAVLTANYRQHVTGTLKLHYSSKWSDHLSAWTIGSKERDPIIQDVSGSFTKSYGPGSAARVGLTLYHMVGYAMYNQGRWRTSEFCLRSVTFTPR
jgi:hypothetical protein